ncbi:putative ATP-dependent RNA helicase DHX35 isoform X2 [Oratosquilla oratoria]|uniref:putative ATP-dependent RNA helicase DHX35 isoform X2 n=1 Tax=Oratosquilla oratoria TaxID=337810 RepID=UPI003F75B35B
MSSLRGRFLKPNDEGFTYDRSDVDQTSGTSFVFNPHVSASIEKQRERLPIFAVRKHILYLLEKYQTLVIVGETGSGKSTQIPQYSVIIMDEVHERTLYTDIILGLLKKIICRRKDLRIIVCSATVDADHLFNFFNSDNSSKKEDSAYILTVSGRTFPVEVFYKKDPCPDYVKGAVETVIQIHKQEPAGDVLVFLTGVEEVDTCVSLLQEHTASMNSTSSDIIILPMHGSLTNSDQLKACQSVPPHIRKVVVSTNVAETSITIPGVVYVVDCGFAKLRWYNPKNHMEALVVTPTSQTSAIQRAGRAGRTRAGKVYRLYMENDYEKLPLVTPPEIVRTNLTPAVLSLMSLGIENMLRFDFPSPPPARNVISALDELYALQALTDQGDLAKPIGQAISEFPLSPQLGKALLASGEFGCSEEMLSIAAMLQVQNVFVRPSSKVQQSKIMHRKFEVEQGDLLTALTVFTAYLQHNEDKRWCLEYFLNYKALKRASQIRESMKKQLLNFGVSLQSCKDVKTICKCITAGLFTNTAYLSATGSYRTVKSNEPLFIHPSSCLYTQPNPQWLVFHEVIHTDRCYISDVCVIESDWLLELAPHYYRRGVHTM